MLFESFFSKIFSRSKPGSYDKMDEIFKTTWERLYPTIVVEFITTKLSKQGIKISTRQKQKWIDHYIVKKDFNIQFQRWIPWGNKSLKIEFSNEEISILEMELNKIEENAVEIIQTLINKTSDALLKINNKRNIQHVISEEKFKQYFEKEHLNLWSKPINLLKVLHGMSIEFANNILSSIPNDEYEKRKYTFEVLSRLHARACQIVLEIITLLFSGYAEGAMARWRSLHEISVISHFILKHSEEAAERYILHKAVGTYKAARQYNQNPEIWGDDNISDAEMEIIESEYNQVIEKYGTDFSKDYGWATIFLDGSRPTFYSIEKSINMNYIRPFYQVANDNIHAHSSGIFYRLGLLEEVDPLFVGPTNYGLADPGKSCALSLAQVCSTLITFDSSFKNLVGLKMIDKLSRDISKIFKETQKSIISSQQY